MAIWRLGCALMWYWKVYGSQARFEKELLQMNATCGLVPCQGAASLRKFTRYLDRGCRAAAEYQD